MKTLQHVAANNYSGFVNLRILQSSTAHVNSFRFVFNSEYLVTDRNNVLSSLRYRIAIIPHLTHGSNSHFRRTESYNHSYFTTGRLPPLVSCWHLVHWGSRPFILCLQINPCGHSPYITPSLTRKWVCFLTISVAFVNCTQHTYSMLLKFVLCALHIGPVSVQTCNADIDYITYLILQ
jgi:hypothetical protein